MTAATVFNLHQEIQYDSEVCITCGVAFWVPAVFKSKRISDKAIFYCPSGHSMAYAGESDEDKAARLANELAASKRNAQSAWEQSEKLAAANRKLRRRAKNGVCPCCKRTFKELAAHMASKHPEFKP